MQRVLSKLRSLCHARGAEITLLLETPKAIFKLPQACITYTENVPPAYSYVKNARETKKVLRRNYLASVYVFSELDYTILPNSETKKHYIFNIH